MNNCLYWIWLTQKYGITSAKISSLLDKFGTIDAIYNSDSYKDTDGINKKDAESLSDKSLDKARSVYDRMCELGGHILTYDMDGFPDKLRNITPVPYILYVRGRYINLDEVLTIGVVGSRHAADYGRLATARLSAELSRRGVVLISGMARGLDSVASSEAIKNNMPTVVVIGSGVDVVYPRENEQLMSDIMKTGMVISEYPPGSEPKKEHFPQRNRIIAGLSNGVLITQAAKKSGSLITARCAMEYGRDVFAVPGNIFDAAYEGTNSIIQQGAKLVMSAEDIIDEYPYAKFITVKKKVMEPQKDEDAPLIKMEERSKDIADTDSKIIGLLIQKDMSADELAEKTQISAQEINTKMTMLELGGRVEKLPGGIYRIKA